MGDLLDTTDDALSIPVARARSREDLIACLERARVLAGPLSHREIASRSQQRLRRTKIGQVLAGEFPRRDFLLTYLEVCGVPEADRTEWLRVWARLVTRPSPEDAPVSGEATHVPTPTTAAPVTLPEVRRLRADLDAALRALRQRDHENQELQRRLTGAESAYAAAVAQDRALRDQLERAQGRISDLSELVNRRRAEERPAGDEENAPPAQLRAPGQTREAKYTVAYTPAETEDIFGGGTKAVPPVVGL